MPIQLNQINSSGLKSTHYDATISLALIALSVVFLIAIYLASMSHGTAPGELATMTVLP